MTEASGRSRRCTAWYRASPPTLGTQIFKAIKVRTLLGSTLVVVAVSQTLLVSLTGLSFIKAALATGAIATEELARVIVLAVSIRLARVAKAARRIIRGWVVVAFLDALAGIDCLALDAARETTDVLFLKLV